MPLVATIVFLVLASCNATKYLHAFPHYRQVKDPYPADATEVSDSESTGMLARLSDRLRSSGEADGPGAWDSVPDPRMYVLTQLESQAGLPASYQVDNGIQEDTRAKRRGPSLSIVNPLEVLQEKWLMNINRKQKEQIQNNRELLSKIGKRTGYHTSANTAFNEIPPRFWPMSVQK